ncbi:MAG: cupin domain-containing protein [bacterium]|nr:cupin domain-containing protein [bacterium]
MNSPNYNKEDLIQELGLQPHPEGGFYKETYRSEHSIPNAVLAGNHKGDRSYGTGIYFMLTSDTFSAFHRIEQDELWFFHQGNTIELHTISPDGVHTKHLIGNNILEGEQPQLLVPATYWFGAKVVDEDSFALVSCTVSPGFDFRDFVLPSREELTSLYPQHKEIIAEFTRH